MIYSKLYLNLEYIEYIENDSQIFRSSYFKEINENYIR